MSTPHSRMLRRFWLTGAALSGCVFQLGWLPSCSTALTTVNPCGTVFAFCTPEDIDLIFADIPDYEVDPTCTIPGFGYSTPNTEPPANTSPTGCANQPVYPYTPGPRP